MTCQRAAVWSALRASASLVHAQEPLAALTATGRCTLTALVQRSDQNRRALLEQAGVAADDLAAARAVLARLTKALRNQSS